MPDSTNQPTKRPLLIGLTGGIASGKSQVAALFAALGVKIIDADLIARTLVQPGSPGLAAIVTAFGAQILNERGELQREALSQHIFADALARQRLNAILHPLIQAQMLAEITARSGEPYLILVIPLLLETGQQRQVDRVLLIDCPVKEQERRLMERNQIDKTRARAMIAAQASRKERSAIAHDLLHNSNQKDLEALPAQVADLHQHYLQLARARSS